MPVPKGFVEKKLDFPVSRCAAKSFRIKVLNKDRRILICCPKGKWDAKRERCRVGTRGTKMQVRRKK